MKFAWIAVNGNPLKYLYWQQIWQILDNMIDIKKFLGYDPLADFITDSNHVRFSDDLTHMFIIFFSIFSGRWPIWMFILNQYLTSLEMCMPLKKACLTKKTFAKRLIKYFDGLWQICWTSWPYHWFLYEQTSSLVST